MKILQSKQKTPTPQPKLIFTKIDDIWGLDILDLKDYNAENNRG